MRIERNSARLAIDIAKSCSKPFETITENDIEGLLENNNNNPSNAM